jgi:type II secretory ATPase GspE/PulE/Tfp pilus assembly ATPase PilB-like protein
MKVLPSVKDFSLTDAEMKALARELSAPGIKVVYGPARSGKSALLRLIFSEMKADWNGANVLGIGMTSGADLERFGVHCAQLNPGVGLTSARAVEEACYGQSADVIVLERLTDAATAKAAHDAALCGKVVLTEMAAGSAGEVKCRLAALLDNDPRLGNALNLFIGTRLLRALCPACKKPLLSPEELKKKFAPHEQESVAKISEPVGCSHCNTLGYRGQRGFCEVENGGELISESMLTKLENALQSGLVSLAEIQRVIVDPATLRELRVIVDIAKKGL